MLENDRFECKTPKIQLLENNTMACNRIQVGTQRDPQPAATNPTYLEAQAKLGGKLVFSSDETHATR